MTPNTIKDGWFPEACDTDAISSSEELILEYMKDKAMCYPTEIADDLGTDPRTVRKCLKHLLALNRIERVDMSHNPTAEQRERIKELKANGMRQNHFKNAKWYVSAEGNHNVS